MNNSIIKIKEKELCIGCGACESICSVGAIAIQFNKVKGCFEPCVNHSLCINCGKCLDVCPSFEIDFYKLLDKSNRNKIINNLGVHGDCYIGHSNNFSCRKSSSSGGVTREVLKFLLEKKYVDGVLVVAGGIREKFCTDIICECQKIDKIQNSIYTCVDYASGVRKFKDFKGRLAIVGLPCQVTGMRKLACNDKEVRDKIVFYVGLICQASFNHNSLKFIQARKKISIINKIVFRFNGWPGMLNVNNNIYKRREQKKNVGNYLDYKTAFKTDTYKLKRCLFCLDHMNISADLVVGDAWLKEFKNDTMGRNILLAKDRKINKILNAMNKDGVIRINKTKIEKIISSQGVEKINALSERKKRVLSGTFLPNYKNFREIKVEVGFFDRIKYFYYISLLRNKFSSFYKILLINSFFKFYILPAMRKLYSFKIIKKQ